MMKKNNAFGSCDMKTMINCSLIIFSFGALATFSYYRINFQELAIFTFKLTPTITITTNAQSNLNSSEFVHQIEDRRIEDHHIEQTGSCDLFSGKWVHDNESRYPLYKEHECPYLEDTFACQTYGRKNTKYLHWKWQPHGCNLPRFDGRAIVEKLRGKRLLFVGDSLNRNQWNSMVCMLQPSISGVKLAGKTLDGKLHTFRATDYNISVDFYWAPMLVESNGDSPTDHNRKDRVFRITAIQKHARHWVDADVLIFNSYHWWRKTVIKLVKDVGSVLDGADQMFEEVDNVHAYKMGLETWSNWASTRLDLSKTKLFFMGATATHSRAADWRGNNQSTCYGEVEPVMDNEFRENEMGLELISILESSLSKLKAKGVNVQFLNITRLTQYRKDAHTSVYRKIWRPLTELQKSRPERASDCSHWCLPGVPDTWNELLLASILQ
ncbi:protein trichome birefringence-like 34 [Rutidosis leptorrhynchoides]|uniref:protein trichome birefringence-like 34 n=1 Tax=Rutidosis leptorrhynchoides TaxID=125765 RepID=UPI003A99B8BF